MTQHARLRAVLQTLETVSVVSEDWRNQALPRVKMTLFLQTVLNGVNEQTLQMKQK